MKSVHCLYFSYCIFWIFIFFFTLLPFLFNPTFYRFPFTVHFSPVYIRPAMCSFYFGGTAQEHICIGWKPFSVHAQSLGDKIDSFCTWLLEWRGSWSRTQIFRFTGQFMFQPSHMVMSSGWSPWHWDCRYKCLKLVSFIGWLGSALERRLDMWRKPGVEPVLLHIEKSQLRWFRACD